MKKIPLSLSSGLGWLLSRARKRRANRFKRDTFLMVVSGFDGETYGPFRTLGDAAELAEDMNGSIFECPPKRFDGGPRMCIDAADFQRTNEVDHDKAKDAGTA